MKHTLSGIYCVSALFRQRSPGEAATVFFDPNTLSEDGTAALSTYAFSDEGSYFAYGISYSGSDWVTIHVQNEDGKKLEDTIEWAKFTSISWTKDDKGFFYNRYPKPEENVDAGTETSANYNGMVSLGINVLFSSCSTFCSFITIASARVRY